MAQDRRDVKVVRATRAGLVPDDKNEPYTVTTAQMREYLQRQLDVVITDTNQHLAEGQAPMSNVQIKAYSCRMGEHFYPLVVTLPGTVIYKRAKKLSEVKNENNGRLNIANDIHEDLDDYGKGIRIQAPVYGGVKRFMYPDGGKGLDDQNARRNLGISASDAANAKRMCKLKRIKINKGGCLVTVMIDPFAVMSDMLVVNGDNRPYQILMHRAKRVRDGEYKFTITRSIREKKNKGGNATLERKIVCVSAKTSYKIQELYELSIRKFLMLLSAVDDAMTYETTRIGLMTGMVSTKEPLQHWIYKSEDEDLYGAAVDAQAFKENINGA